MKFCVIDIGSNSVRLMLSENGKTVYKKVKMIFDDDNYRKHIAKNAYLTVCEEWNADNAAKKFVTLCEKILAGEYKPYPFEKGVCSKANITRDGWYSESWD